MKKILNFIASEIGRIILGLLLFVSALVVELFSFEAVSVALYLSALVVAGAGVFVSAARGILRRDLLDEKFLMSVASVGSVILGEVGEGAAVMLFFLIGEYFEHRAVAHSKRSIRALMDICPDEATIISDGVEERVDAEDVPIGSTIIIRTGERVALDSVVISGNADIDTSAITGEAIARSVGVGSNIESGTVVVNGVLFARTVRTASNSSAARILSLVEDANERKSKAESFITRFSRFYTPAVVGLAVAFAVVPPLLGLISFSESVYRALTFLVISCPCALVISVPMSFFGGIGGAASKGILYKGGNTFSALARADSFVFDKTGTLTSGEFSVTDVQPINVKADELLYYSASAEYASTHPVAHCLKNASKNKVMPTRVNEIAGKGVSSIVDGHNILVGNALLMNDNGVEIPSNVEAGVLLVAKDGHYIGAIKISDSIKPEAKRSICSLRRCGVKNIVMLSGDRRANAERVGTELSFDSVKSELLPHEKFEALEEIISNSQGTVYVGDGINDAPSIARADVGIAMGRIGSDSAIEAADVVITSDNLEKLPVAIKIARKTVRIATENIAFAISVKLLVLLLGAFGYANMWFAVFADVGVAVIAILNAMRTLKVGD